MMDKKAHSCVHEFCFGYTFELAIDPINYGELAVKYIEN